MKLNFIKFIIITLAISPMIAFASESTITVQVQLTAPHNLRIWAVGFSVGKKSAGSLGRTTSKTGPAGGHYAFGLQAADDLKVSCGNATLIQDSLVKLVYDGKTCHIEKIVPIKN